MVLFTQEAGPVGNPKRKRGTHTNLGNRSLAYASGYLCCVSLVVLFCATASAEDNKPKFRTDDNRDKKLSWYVPKKGKFPPAGSAHAIRGELIWVDYPEREFHIRVDRDDSQSRAVWDMPLPLTMLPYGSIYYNGQPAALQDIPLGTHLHTLCYVKDPDDKRPPLARWHNRISPESDFRQCIRIEDDFSYRARRNQLWRVDEVDRESMKLTATLLTDGKPEGKAITFDLLPNTVVYQSNGFGTLDSIQPGQEVLMNLTWVTLAGPGRVFQICLDEESRQLASQRQSLRHNVHIRQRGIPGWIDAVDDEKSEVTMTLFDGIDMSLFESFDDIVPEPFGWPTSGGAKDNNAPKGTLAVARSSLMTYEPGNDRKGGNILKTNKVPIVPGCCGIQIRLQVGLLLEGYRPGEVVRFYPASWKFESPPKEEQYFGRE